MRTLFNAPSQDTQPNVLCIFGAQLKPDLILSLLPHSRALSSFRGWDLIGCILHLSVSKTALTLYHSLLPIQASVETSTAPVPPPCPLPNLRTGELIIKRMENFQSHNVELQLSQILWQNSFSRVDWNPEEQSVVRLPWFHKCVSYRPWTGILF